MTKKIILTMLVCCLVSVPALCSSYARGNYVPPDRMLGEGEVKAEIVKDLSQVPGGPKRESRIGDFKIYNNQVAFVIAGTRLANGKFMFGGVIEDAALMKPDGDGGRWYNLMGDTGFLLFKGSSPADPLLGTRKLAPVTAEILKDGSDGEAVVRIKALDAEWNQSDDDPANKMKALKIKAVVDYILKPDSPVLEIKMTLMNGKSSSQSVSIGQQYLMGDGSNLFVPGFGFDVDNAYGQTPPAFVSVGGGVSYGWFTDEDTVEVNAGQNTTFGKVKLKGKGGTESLSIYMVVGEDGASSVMERMYKFKGITDYGIVRGKCVSTGSGEPAAGVMVHALNADGAPVTNADVQADGSFRLALPPGDYTLRAISYDRHEAVPVSVSVSAGETTEAAMEIGEPATLEYEVTDDSDNIIPATIAFKKTGEAAGGKGMLNNSFYYNKTHGYGAGFFKIHFAAPGQGKVDIRPGAYDVFISRGFEYEYVKKSLPFEAGQTISEKIVLDHVVDTTGYLSGDFHIHSQPSRDTSDLIYDKLSAAAAQGVEVPIATDHDVHTNYAPYINEMGLNSTMKSIIGDEMTTNYGHFNAFPVKYDPARKNGGGLLWQTVTPVQSFAELRKDPAGNTLIQVNHPRWGGTGGGYFNNIDWDAEAGVARNPKNFSLNYDGMEILNGPNLFRLPQTLPDWYSFLNRGKLLFGVGNSDNHSTFNLGLGYPRNFVVSSTDNPEELDLDAFIEAVRTQKVTLCAGAFVTSNLDGKAGMGEILEVTDGEAQFNVKVQAASWAETKTLTIVEGGKTIETIDISAVDSPVRYDGTVTVKPERDTWYVAVVDGEKDLFPIYPGTRTFAVTNPVYVDVDGNGKYDPPLEFNNTPADAE